jgi:hypothetical protein
VTITKRQARLPTRLRKEERERYAQKLLPRLDALRIDYGRDPEGALPRWRAECQAVIDEVLAGIPADDRRRIIEVVDLRLAARGEGTEIKRQMAHLRRLGELVLDVEDCLGVLGANPESWNTLLLGELDRLEHRTG